MPHLRRPVALTRIGMTAEVLVRAFWPFWSVGFVVLAPLMMGWQDLLSVEVFWAFAVISAVALIAAFVWGVRRFRLPSRQAAVARVDAALPGRPIAAIADSQAIGAGDPASEAVWSAHVARMQDRTRDARMVEPDLRVSNRDPFGVRFIALLLFVTALLFGSVWRVGSVGEIAGGDTQVLATGPVWEGWVEPPNYTGKPTLYLNDIPEGALRVPAGSKITLRLYGDVGALTVAETVSGRTQELGAASEAQQSFLAAQSGKLAIEGENGAAWDVTLVADAAPIVELIGPVEADADGEMSQPFQAIDDYGIISGTAQIALNLEAVDRRYGLAIAPDARDPLVLDLPMPFSGDRADFEAFLVENLSEDALANLPVTLTMEVVDAAGQVGTSPPEAIVLPGRRFFQPFAKAVIEMRRDMLWSKANGKRVSQVLRAISNKPEGLFSDETNYLRLRVIIGRLDSFIADGMTDENQAELAQALWDLAIQLEDGTLADARERLQRAQERLAEAMRNGASDEEIAELMQELRAATDDYMQMLADQMDPEEDGTDERDMSQDENTMQLSMDEIQALMDRIQELMEEGRMAEAEELMAQLNALMENLRIAQSDGEGNGPRTPGQQSMQDLSDTLREQQDLSDDAFRDLQDRAQQGQQPRDPSGGQDGQEPGDPSQQGQSGQDPGQGQEGQQGQTGDPSGQDGEGQGAGEQTGRDGSGAGGEGSLAERQEALRDALGDLRDGLPNLSGEEGEIARRALERAEGAMDGAEEALRNGDLAEAIDRQAEALDALRNGMRSLGEALAQNQPDGQGPGSEQGVATPERDPLGRGRGENAGQRQGEGDAGALPGIGDPNRRAGEILDEIRRRSAEQDRSETERDYLRRLLDRF